ncbi:hypothetical protein G6F58_013121 [Rhizopus delemar]|nr:hypothetical protein G6F58_013121 [Rhizopus delemar]
MGRLALRVEYAAQVVRMGMGQQHLVHLGRVHAGGAQVAQHLAQAGAEALRGAGVDQALSCLPARSALQAGG